MRILKLIVLSLFIATALAEDAPQKIPITQEEMQRGLILQLRSEKLTAEIDSKQRELQRIKEIEIPVFIHDISIAHHVTEATHDFDGSGLIPKAVQAAPIP